LRRPAVRGLGARRYARPSTQENFNTPALAGDAHPHLMRTRLDEGSRHNPFVGIGVVCVTIERSLRIGWLGPPDRFTVRSAQAQTRR